MSNFYKLDMIECANNELILPSSTKMISAIEKASGCTLINMGFKNIGTTRIEFIIFDILSDKIPTRNKFGIEYIERIALVFETETETEIPQTLALRNNFPTTMHQNFSLNDGPKDLCLFLEPQQIILTNWTPQRHIRRIKWWLIQAANGELHDEDQPVEQFFFNPIHTIIIPFDFAEGQKNRKKNRVDLIPQLNSLNQQVIRVSWDENKEVTKSRVSFIDVVVEEAVTHGRIRLAPQNLTELIELMNSLSINFLELLRDRLYFYKKDQEGPFDIPLIILLVTILIRRSDDGNPESKQIIGFCIKKTVYELLCNLDVFIPNINCFNIDLYGKLHPMTSGIPDFELYPVEILKTTDSTERRKQSGYLSNINKGVLIGAGSLGSNLLDIWVRGGWGKWTILDNDILRPHNFTRHIAPSSMVGQNKSMSVAYLCNDNFSDAVVKYIPKNACEFNDDEIISCIKQADLVVDASTTLEYPREISLRDDFPRHVSVFFSPNGSDAVLLIEDNRRKIRLSSLEAQYYRSLITLEVGNSHLTQHHLTFRSGISCRDLSVVMSFARTTSLSSLLSEQILLASNKNESSIKIWQDNCLTGERKLTEITPNNMKCNKYDSSRIFTVYWDEEIEMKVRSLRTQALPFETGGILIGYHDMVRRTVFIVDAVAPSPDSKATTSTFTRGILNIEETLKTIYLKTAGNVIYIGEWHTHPDGVSSDMSELDIIQLNELAEKLSLDGLPAYQMIVSQNQIVVHEKWSLYD